METQTRRVSTKLLVLAAYLVMILVNALANILPINGITTGEVSDSYPNLFAPAGLTFAMGSRPVQCRIRTPICSHLPV